jgi:hypothetical protein
VSETARWRALPFFLPAWQIAAVVVREFYLCFAHRLLWERLTAGAYEQCMGMSWLRHIHGLESLLRNRLVHDGCIGYSDVKQS